MNAENKEFYCQKIVTWAKKRKGEASTWRGLALSGAALVAAINPAAGAMAAKVAAVIVGVIDVVKDESKRASDQVDRFEK